MRAGARVCFVDTGRRADPCPTCPNAAAHTATPRDYAGWFEWARVMARTHVQRRCPVCLLFVIWTPKVTCRECGQKYAPIGDGSPRSHKRGPVQRCPGAHQPPREAVT